MRSVDGQQKQGILQRVLFIPELRRNLFSIGLASKQAYPSRLLGRSVHFIEISEKDCRSWKGLRLVHYTNSR